MTMSKITLPVFQEIVSLLKNLKIEYNESEDIFTITGSDEKLEEVESLFNRNNLQNEKILNEGIRLLNYDLDDKIFYNDDHFKRSSLEINDFELNLLVFNFDSIPRYFDGNSKNTYINSNLEDRNYFFMNSYWYLMFLEEIKKQEKDENNIFSFVDYFNIDIRKMVFVTNNGKLIINYNEGVPVMNENYDFGESVRRFIKCFDESNKQLPSFLKKELFNNLKGVNQDERMASLISNLNLILNSAYMNFEVYLNELSLEKIKADYKDYKQKYFEQLSKILNGITNKVISIPIAISASFFAIDKSSTSIYVVSVICLALIISARA
jgi:hypothetical protein